MVQKRNRGEVLVSFLRASFSPKSFFPPVWFAESDDSHLLPEERHDYYGSGRATIVERKRDSDDDLIRQVIDKWDAIERAQADSRVTEPAIEAVTAVDLDPSEKTENEAALAASTDVGIPRSVVSAALNESIAQDAIAAARAKAQRNDEALALILACL